MKKEISITLFLSIILIFFWGCKDNATNSNIQEASAEKQFVWNAMNYWYYWQADVPRLRDDKAFFDNEQAYHGYLMEFQDAEGVFNNLIYQAEDDFSFFIEDYEVFQQSRQGISQDFGFEYGLVQSNQNSSNLYAYVQYVLDDTPAANAGLTRGDIFTGINGTQLTISNYTSLLSNSTYELTLAESVDGQISNTGETVTMNATQITEDPIYLSKVIDTGSAKVGYLMYNSFQTNSHENLNNVFENFISEDIDEFVLDLRYNGGGAVITSATLASMISGIGSSEIFAEYTFNEKRANQGSTLTFQDELSTYNDGEQTGTTAMSKLALDRLYVLTGFNTASASEAIINGLNPFMEVTLIGRQTVGKDDASLTLYDNPNNSNSYAPFTSRENANPDHKNAIQPIVLKVKNSAGESNGVGFMPEGDNFIREIDFLINLGTLPPLGDENDPLLARTIELITGEPLAKSFAEPRAFLGEMFKDSRDLEQFGKDMYILPSEAEEMELTPEIPLH